jgi:hypothetical protein
MGRRPFVVGSVALWASLGCQGGGGGGTLCELTITKNALSSNIPTVGVIEWSLAGGPPSSAKIVYALEDAPSSILNRGGEAPVQLAKPNYRTLLLGLKQASHYMFHVEAVRDGQTCVSRAYSLPTTGRFAAAPPVSVTVPEPDRREAGFIVTSSGVALPSSAFIIDADGEIVWAFDAPENTTRALMDYEGDNMWMIALNLLNEGGEMRRLSMDGAEELDDVPGLETTHHDFTVIPGGRVAALAWSVPGDDPESDLLIRSPDGTVATAFTIGRGVYLSDYFHANAIHYLPSDGSFTIADRNPNVVVKVSATGAPQWQVGGACDGAPAGDRCSPQEWQVNHGHHLTQDGQLVVFNNGWSGNAHVLEFELNHTSSAFAATLAKDYPGTDASTTLGDVQRLPGGNTLVTYSEAGKIVELDPDWNEVQTFSVRVGYSSWRPTLYGPPVRP